MAKYLVSPRKIGVKIENTNLSLFLGYIRKGYVLYVV